MPCGHWVSLSLFFPFFPNLRSLSTPPTPTTCHPSAQTQEGKGALSPRLMTAHPQPRSLGGQRRAGQSSSASAKKAKQEGWRKRREKEEPQISRLKLRTPVPLTCFRQGPQDFRQLYSLSLSQRSSRRAAHLTPGAGLRCPEGPGV